MNGKLKYMRDSEREGSLSSLMDYCDQGSQKSVLGVESEILDSLLWHIRYDYQSRELRGIERSEAPNYRSTQELGSLSGFMGSSK